MRFVGQLTLSTIGATLISISSDHLPFLADMACSVVGLGMILGVGVSIGRERAK